MNALRPVSVAAMALAVGSVAPGCGGSAATQTTEMAGPETRSEKSPDVVPLGPTDPINHGPDPSRTVHPEPAAAEESPNADLLNADEVAKRIREKYLAGIKRCHERALRIDPNVEGLVSFKFTIGPTGQVTETTIAGFSPLVDACIKEETAKWRFSTPKDDAGKPTSVTFSVPLMLKPGG